MKQGGFINSDGYKVKRIDEIYKLYNIIYIGVISYKYNRLIVVAHQTNEKKKKQ